MNKNTVIVFGTMALVVAVLIGFLGVANASVAAAAPTKKEKKEQKAKQERKRWIEKCVKRHRNTGHSSQVQRWKRPLARAMYDLNIRCKHVPGILNQIRQESGGNKKAVNNWDINARNGVPSKGLLQVIAPTYLHYAKDGKRSLKYQTHAYPNLYAALNYTLHRYGVVKFRLWARGFNQGY